MSRISDALKRSGAADMTAGFEDLSVTEVADLGVEPAPMVLGEPQPLDELPVMSSPAGVHNAPGLFDDVTARWSDKLIANPSLPSIAVEQYRRLAAILHHAQEDRGIRRVLVASALAEEGKTLTATNLALTLSESYGRRVLLVDADLRRPGISLAMGLPHGAGLSNVLYTIEQEKLPLLTVSEKLSILPAGQPTSDPMAGLTSSRMAAILEEASAAFDWVIIDSPPIGVLPDAKLLAAMVDGALLVIRAGSTPFAAIQRAADSLGRERLLGVVLNRVDESIAAPGEYYYRYYGYSGTDRGKPGLLHRFFRRRR
jgi:capsular exopolysaccharide synthesis family protein